jgi:DNA-binding transcriptional ArsR family regulator
MSRQVSELQTILAQLTAEHRKLLAQMDSQHAAMMKLDITTMGDLINQQEATRLRINNLEGRRKAAIRQLAATLRMNEQPTLSHLAEIFPQQAAGLLKARQELREVIGKVSQRSRQSGRLAGAVLGHLNTAMRLLAAAVERAGLYTRRGVPRLATRIGVMEAVG